MINTLKEVDLIAAEDTRHSIKLLNHFEIKTKMTSYHEYNRVEKAKVLVKQLQEGKNIALITDAGTPGISDPGEELVRQCLSLIHILLIGRGFNQRRLECKRCRKILVCCFEGISFIK